MTVAPIVKVSFYKTMRLPPKVQAYPQTKRPIRARSPAAPWRKRPVLARSLAASGQSVRYVRGPQRAKKPRSIRLRFLAAPQKMADTFTVFNGAPKSGRYVYGFQWPPKNGRYVYCFQQGPKKRPIRLRFLAGPKKTADTFTVFGTSPTPNARYATGL